MPGQGVGWAVLLLVLFFAFLLIGGGDALLWLLRQFFRIFDFLDWVALRIKA